jgi:serine/threonine protein kinase
MGAVFVAEQSEPVRRKVALKLIKPGMDSKQVLARFGAERQALALMDHPNIARILDGGTTDAGRPYFVMDLVRGIPITEYCDRVKATGRVRLELFVKVCQAIQHAHQKGVIHRDIKPSNVLVTSHDGVPVPIVIDFGVAKALGHQLTAPPGKVQVRWSGTVPPQKWMNFYTKVLTRFASSPGLTLEVSFEVPVDREQAPTKVEETRTGLKELGLNDGVTSG